MDYGTTVAGPRRREPVHTYAFPRRDRQTAFEREKQVIAGQFRKTAMAESYFAETIWVQRMAADFN